MSALLLTVLLAMAPPGDATRLAPDPVESPAPIAADQTRAPTTPMSPSGGPVESPLVALGSVLAAAALLTAGTRSSRREDLEGQPLVVFVPGHGNVGSDFDGLVDLMDLETGDYRVFDYRWMVETGDHAHASQTASIDSTADALNAYLAGLADGDRNLYLVGFSKGGAGIAELLSRWDDGVPPAVPGVIGAALLDPPISGGFQGTMQSLGRYVGPIPDDGGYDPVGCDWTGLLCEDQREHLGEGAGVEVMVLRNPKAGVTNFNDRPAGLRVYDVPDEGRGPGAAFFHNPLTFGTRVAEAHDAVLHDRRVADCIRAEMIELGSCDLPTAVESVPLVRSGGGGGGGAVLLAD